MVAVGHVLVGLAVACNTQTRRRTHSIKHTQTTPRARVRGQYRLAEGRKSMKLTVQIQGDRLLTQVGLALALRLSLVLLLGISLGWGIFFFFRVFRVGV